MWPFCHEYVLCMYIGPSKPCLARSGPLLEALVKGGQATTAAAGHQPGILSTCKAGRCKVKPAFGVSLSRHWPARRQMSMCGQIHGQQHQQAEWVRSRVWAVSSRSSAYQVSLCHFQLFAAYGHPQCACQMVSWETSTSGACPHAELERR